MHICEKLSILALDEKTGLWVVFDPYNYLDYVLSAAIIEDLICCKRVRIENDNIKVIEPADLDSPILTEALFLILRARQPYSVHYWITQFPQYFGNVVRQIYESLADANILERMTRKRFLRKAATGYKITNPELIIELIAESTQSCQDGDKIECQEIEVLQSLHAMLRPSSNFLQNHESVLPNAIEECLIENPICRALQVIKHSKTDTTIPAVISEFYVN
jgi:hypothetical protein